MVLRYSGVLGIEEPHQSIPNLVVKDQEVMGWLIEGGQIKNFSIVLSHTEQSIVEIQNRLLLLLLSSDHLIAKLQLAHEILPLAVASMRVEGGVGVSFLVMRDPWRAIVLSREARQRRCCS